MGRNLAIGFLDKIHFCILNIPVCVLCVECGYICMISICVADNSYNAFVFLSFFFITQIILIVFFCGQINLLYDV